MKNKPEAREVLISNDEVIVPREWIERLIERRKSAAQARHDQQIIEFGALLSYLESAEQLI